VKRESETKLGCFSHFTFPDSWADQALESAVLAKNSFDALM
jgi:hypothetical protein